MAQYLLVSALVHTPPGFGSPFSANDVVDVYWDDSTEALVVKKNGVVWAGALGAYLGDLNTNFYVSGITSYDGDYAVAGYSFCDGANLKWFRMLTSYPSYPYMTKMTTVDSPVCDVGGGVVCDIHFTSARVVTPTTSLTNPNGGISTTAASSNGTVKFALFDFDYATEGQTSGSFSGLNVGTLYHLYAKDPNDCTLHITFSIWYEPENNEHYRLTWKNLDVGEAPRNERLRIYEREYVGSVVELDYAGTQPFVKNKPKQGDLNDKFYPIHPTNATLILQTEEDHQFQPLATQDNKKYLCVHEIEEDSEWVEVWQGFVAPSVWQEDFLPGIPHTVEVPITDNVKTLEEEDFTDDDGNLLTGQMKLIKVIALIMKKTGLSLKIRCGLNIFEVNHTQDSDGSSDPFDQTYIDVTCYRDGTTPFKCWAVLEAILRPFLVRILQEDNQWIIEEIDRSTAEYAYRVFTVEGEYESNSTFNPILEIKNPSETNRVALLGRSHSQEIIPAYGKIDVITKFNYVGAVPAGGFEQEDLLSPSTEERNIEQGIFISEEGFKDWTLRQPAGVSGVSFGRILVSYRGDSSRTGLKTTAKESTRSVGAFFFDPRGWSGNLRDAYIESAEKPYQYGYKDELKLTFEYSTPAKPEFEFMVLRMMIKLGDKYLQPDKTWSTTESIYRTYPPVSNTLQRFELSTLVPSTNVVVDTTIQIRIYFYSPGFYDYGLPTSTDDINDGTDGLALLKAFPTEDINYDYRVDIRQGFSINGTLIDVVRAFYELKRGIADEVIDSEGNNDGSIVHPNDYDPDTNSRVWHGLKGVIAGYDEVNLDRRGADIKFYLDNIGLDSLPNGQPPPEDETTSLKISEFVNEKLEFELYNFDAPDITNAKNMFNNHFRLSDGSPTSAWARSGINESLKIQQIMLKVLGGNYSAPTTRLTGQFIDEFSRIKFTNYLKITEVGATLSMSNTTFDSDLSDWDGDASGEAFAWSADNSGSAEVTLSGAENSEKRYQDVTHNGGQIQVSFNIHVVPTAGNDREDQLWLLFYKNGAIVQTEKLQTFIAPSEEDDYSFTYRTFLPKKIDRIGFYIKRVTGAGECSYQITEFAPEGADNEKVFQIADVQYDTRKQQGYFELMQLSKSYTTLVGVDSGGNGQVGNEDGGDFNGDFNNDFGADFDTITN